MEMRNASPDPSSGPSTTAGRKRGKTPCCSKMGLKRGPWTPEEDEVLASVVRREGEGRWRTLPKRAGLLRCGKSCRLRWMNYLRPSIKHGPIAPDEEDLILRLHRLLGNKWSLIAGRIPGRTDNEIKNYWNSHLSKKLLSQGIDPRTHKPLDPSSPSPLPVDHNLKTPAAAPVPVLPNPNPNPRANPSANAAHELTPSAPHVVGGSSRGVFLGDDHGNYFSGFDLEQDETWRSFGTVGSVDRCTDDSFSSFLESLIDEDSTFLDPPQQPRLNQMEPADPTMPELRFSGHQSSLDENVSGQF